MEMEQARYEAKLSARRYEAVDPGHRLVVAELEARWNVALRKAREMEDRLRVFDDAGRRGLFQEVVLLIHWAGGGHSRGSMDRQPAWRPSR